jgi:hypothetical protein
LQIVDRNGKRVGTYLHPDFVGVTIGAETVLVPLDTQNSNFKPAIPGFFYVSSNCSGAPLMFAPLVKFGIITDNTLYYPIGEGAITEYHSVSTGATCTTYTGINLLAPQGRLSVSNLVAPFKLVDR